MVRIENQLLEFKERLEFDEPDIRDKHKQILIKEVIGFLNAATPGGVIEIGVNDNGEIVGLKVPDIDRYIQQIINILFDNILPKIQGLVEVKAIFDEEKAKSYIRISIADGAKYRPFFYAKFGASPKGCFERLGSQVFPMEFSRIQELQNKSVDRTIQSIPSPIQALSFEYLKLKYQDREMQVNNHFERNLELYSIDLNRGFNYTAYLLSDQCQLEFDFVTYKGDTKSNILSRKTFKEQSIIKTFEEILEKVELINETLIDEIAIIRNEQDKIDMVAFRETLVNAFIHNDYLLVDGHAPIVEVYDSSIQVTSYGIPLVSKEEFFSGLSSRRNRVLAAVFKDIGYGEGLGSGIKRILDTYSKDVFHFYENSFRVSLPFAQRNEKVQKVENLEYEITVDDVKELSHNELLVYVAIGDSRAYTRQELSEKTGLSDKTTIRTINLLIDKNKLERIGDGYNTKYIKTK